MSTTSQALEFLSSPPIIAVTTAFITTVGVKLVERNTKGREIKVDESTSLRIELRAEIDKLRISLRDKEISEQTWREKFYALQEKYNEALNRARIAEADLQEAKEELDRLRPPK